jgi:hypothetical protein
MNKTLVARIVTFLGSSLIPVATASLDQCALPEETQTFLQAHGLPLGLENGLFVHFYADAQVLEVYEDGQKQFLLIGNDSGTELGIKEHTGEILSIDLDETLPTRFVNSSILTLLAFLETYSKEQPRLIQASDKKIAEIVARIKDEWQTLDPKSLADPENWWSVILEQTEQGLL